MRRHQPSGPRSIRERQTNSPTFERFDLAMEEDKVSQVKSKVRYIDLYNEIIFYLNLPR